MRKLFILLIAILAIAPAVSAQTCDCESIDKLNSQMDRLFDYLYSQYLGPLTPVQGTGDGLLKSGAFDPVTISDFSFEYIRAIFRTTKFGIVIQLFVSFTNNSSETVRFSDLFRITAFQNGIGLRMYYSNDLGYSYLRPGKSVDIIKMFILQDRNTPLELEFIPIGSDAAPEIRIIDLSVQ